MLLKTWALESGAREFKVAGRKNRALLTYLAIEQGRSHTRESLADLLWCAAGDTRARASLRQGLASLRANLAGSGIQIDETATNGIEIASGTLSIDAFFLDDEAPQPPSLEKLLQASLRLPELLSDLMGLSQPFDEWICALRERLSDAALNALKSFYAANGQQPEDRIAAGRAALQLDPLSEHAVRAIMEANVDMGQTASALRLYGSFHEMLAEQMDAEPSSQTQDLAVAIKLGKQSAAQTFEQSDIAPPSTASRTITTLAVIPFETLGTKEIPRFVVVGLLERITGLLASLPAPQVISSNSSRVFLDAPPQPKEVRRTLNADYALMGSVFVMDDKATVSTQLVDTQDERVVWSAAYEYAISDFLKLQVPLAEEIMSVVSPSVDQELLRRAHMLNDADIGPHQLVIRARDILFGLENETFEHAGILLQRAANTGPHFALAHLRLAEWHSLGLWEGRAKGANQEALEFHAQRALTLRPGDGRALAFRAHTRFMFDRAHDEALRLIEQALRAGPNDSETLSNCIVAQAHSGEVEAAMEVAEKALRLSPLDPWLFRTQHFASIAYYSGGNFEKASELGLASFQQTPNYLSNVRATIAALVAAERVEETIPLVDHHKAMEPHFSVNALVPKHGFRVEKDRTLYGARLQKAGLEA
ncbi:MAG: BTAD domain-containing putative transcriptional regulator [Paracoccaceae bacterium]